MKLHDFHQEQDTGSSVHLLLKQKDRQTDTLAVLLANV